MNRMIQWLTRDLLVLLLDESLFEWLKRQTFAHLKKKYAHTGISGIYILFLQQVSDSGIEIDFRFPTLSGLNSIHCSPPTGLGMYSA